MASLRTIEGEKPKGLGRKEMAPLPMNITGGKKQGGGSKRWENLGGVSY